MREHRPVCTQGQKTREGAASAVRNRHDHRHRGQLRETQELFDIDKRPGEKCGLGAPRPVATGCAEPTRASTRVAPTTGSLEVGNPALAGTRTRRNKATLVLRRERGRPARIRAARRGSPGLASSLDYVDYVKSSSGKAFFSITCNFFREERPCGGRGACRCRTQRLADTAGSRAPRAIAGLGAGRATR